MPTDNEFVTVTVTVTWDQVQQSFTMSCSPDPVPVGTTGPKTLQFILDQVNTSGWKFMDYEGTDYFDGITVFDDNGQEFNTPSRKSDTVVEFTDLNDNSQTYRYSVQVTNMLVCDPSIQNQG